MITHPLSHLRVGSLPFIQAPMLKRYEGFWKTRAYKWPAINGQTRVIIPKDPGSPNVR